MANSSAMKDKRPIIKASQILLARKVEGKITSSGKNLVSSILKDMPCQTDEYGVSLQKWRGCLETKFGSIANLDIMHEIDVDKTLVITTADHLMLALLASVGHNEYPTTFVLKEKKSGKL